MNDQREPLQSDSTAAGLVLGILSAIGYMVANLGLRGVANANSEIPDVDWAIWVSANKAAPVVIAAWILVGWRATRGLPALPSRQMLLPLILTGLLMQWGGNVSFQFALSRAGLALSVPFSFATILISSAIVGRIAIGDPLTRSTLLAVGVMIAAITILTQGTREATDQPLTPANMASTGLAVGAACLSGLAYGSGGVMIRRCVRNNLSHSATIVVLSTTGLLTLGGMSLVRIGPSRLFSAPPEIWLKMLAAGTATAVAFFAISGAYQHITAVKVSLLNASQIALSALAGVLVFREPSTPWLQAGTVLTIFGLILAARTDAQPAPCPDSMNQ